MKHAHTSHAPESRACGILAHVSSLPGPYGIGDLGDGAYAFVDFLEAAGQTVWQIMPLGPTGYGDSPYAAFSAFAGNPYLISLDELAALHWLSRQDLDSAPAFPRDRVDYGPVIEFHVAMLRKAHEAFIRHGTPDQRRALNAFVKRTHAWLPDFARFMAFKGAHHGAIWNAWSTGKEHVTCARPPGLQNEIAFHTFVQWVFFTQWFELKSYANDKGIRIIGDAPIFVAYDSADVWAHARLFHLDGKGAMTAVSGVPPDFFSETGQLWGNPLYRWDVLRHEKYEWWIERLRWLLKTVDIVRIDHFRGFEACWQVPAGEQTAINGAWVKVPGLSFFKSVREQLGDLPVIAEDLGVITREVDALRDACGFPGMKVLQFGFGGGASSVHLPHNYSPNTVAYTGTHDNDTARGWYASADETVRDHVRRYFGRDGSDIHWDLIRAALASVSRMAVVPIQDVLGLGSEARMNFPGKASGNWQWRVTGEQLASADAARLRALAGLYGRRTDGAME